MAKLVCVDGPAAGVEFALGFYNSIGGALDNSICVRDDSVAQRHALIELRENKYFISRISQDVNLSINGTEIEPESELSHGDMIRLGNITLVFSEEEAEAPSDILKAITPPSTETMTTLMARVKSFKDSQEVIRTFRKKEELQAHIETLYHITSIINSTLNLEDLFSKLYKIMFEILEPDRIFILLYDEAGKLKVFAKKMSDRCQIKGFVHISRSIIKEAMQNKEALLVKSAIFDERFAMKQSVITQNIQSVMCAPLVKREEIMGAMYIDRITTKKQYKEEDLNLLNAISSQVAIAQDNVRMYEKNFEFNRKLTKLSELSRQVSSYLEKDKIIELAAEKATEIFECTKCSILTFNEKSRVLEMEYSNALDKSMWHTIKIKPGEGFCGKVFKENKPLLMTETTGPEPLTEHGYETNSFLIAPVCSMERELAAKAEPVGVIALTDKINKKPFDTMDKELLSIFASQLGTTLNNAILFEKATVDTLTRVYTRQFFFVRLEQELALHKARRQPLSVIMFDLDKFKPCNDTYGHQTGDRLLIELGKILKQLLADHGFIGRYGGDEFIACSPGRDQNEAIQIAEKIRRKIESTSINTSAGSISFTISIGVSFLEERDTVESIVKKADSALYEAKRSGRNKVELYKPFMQTPPPS